MKDGIQAGFCRLNALCPGTPCFGVPFSNLAFLSGWSLNL